MDLELDQLPRRLENTFRSAIYWWLQLRPLGPASHAPTEFAAWIAGSATNRRALVQLEVLWHTVRQAWSNLATVPPTPDKVRPAGEIRPGFSRSMHGSPNQKVTIRSEPFDGAHSTVTATNSSQRVALLPTFQ